MKVVAYSPARSGKMQGSLNDFVRRPFVFLQEQSTASLLSAASWLADAPCGAIGYDFPDELSREVLGVARRNKFSAPHNPRRALVEMAER